MNCSRSSEVARSSVRWASLASSRLMASIWNPMSSAKRQTIPVISGVLSRFGWGSMAHSVPKKLPSGNMIGIEM